MSSNAPAAEAPNAADSGGSPVAPTRTNSSAQNTGRFRQRRQSKSERINEILQVSFARVSLPPRLLLSRG